MKIAVLGLRSIGGECSGGIERHVQELSTRMVALGHEVTVFCRGKYNDVGREYRGVRLVNRPAIYTKHLEAISHTGLSVPATLTGYDIVHFHATGPSLLSWIPRVTGVPTVVTVHGLDFKRAKWGGGATLVLRAGAWTSANCPSQTIVVSKVLADYYRTVYGCQALHIPNGVSQPAYRPIETLKQYGVERHKYILSLGRLVPEKGIHYLIPAFRSIDTKMKLLVVGGDSLSGGYLAELKKLAGSDQRIIFTGPLFGKAKEEVFSNAKLFTIPSDVEGMPIAMLEAMSHGCPVLSSDIPECLEVIEGSNQLVGYTFAQGNITSLSTQLRAVLTDSNLQRVGRNGQNYVLEKFNWDSITVATLAAYQRVHEK